MKELRHVALGILVAFLIVGVMAGYWSVIRSDDLQQRADNPRRFEAERFIQRGGIFDHNGLLLAETTLNYNSTALRRLYPHPEVAPVVGYYSQRYGTSGIEASHNAMLRGDIGPTPLQIAIRDLRHDPVYGGDVQLTLDLLVQKVALAALGDTQGAVVAVSVPDGAIRAMVSSPSFDPNTIDENWNVLVQSEAGPLLNRVTQGVYQPGGALQTVLLAAALSQRVPVDTLLLDADAPVAVNGFEVTCTTPPPQSTLTLAEAYAYGCPAPFTRLLEALEPVDLDDTFWRFGLLTAPDLVGLNTDTADSPLPLAMQTAPEALTAALTGQSSLAISPLQLVTLVAAIANDGNAPLLRVVEAVRPVGAEAWEPVPRPGLSNALLTAENAATLQNLMAAAARGTAGEVLEGYDPPIIGHAATAYSGPEATPLQWFAGLSLLDDGSAIAVVVVLEDATSAAEAARVGAATLSSAAQRHAPPIENAPDTPESTQGVQ